MRRASEKRRVFFFEEHIPTDHHLPYLEFHAFDDTAVVAVRPRVPHDWQGARLEAALAALLDQLLSLQGGAKPILWFYSPMMYPFAAHIPAAAVVYDCMDELSNFRFAPPALRDNERRLMQRADLVFTGGFSIYQAKRDQHRNIHLFPSSVDCDHFATARSPLAAPADQADLPGPVLGYYGVIDERIDLPLIAAVAAARPHWSLVMIGPVAKIDPEELPRAQNIHYLGIKDYADLPAYLAGWDAALMPFAINDATRFISPTKTPEYLSAGKSVVSTPVADVVRHYGALQGVTIADGAAEFVAACEHALSLSQAPRSWQPEADRLLARSSWDETFRQMWALVDEVGTKAEPTLRSPRRWDRGGHYDYLIVGAGFAGSVLAERLACAGKRVFLCDRRDHIAGNTYDFHDRAGILIHKYGPHIFHTNSQEVFAYLSRFTDWRPYEHRVLASVADKLLPMPINRTTLNGLYGLDLSNDAAAAAFLAGRAEPVEAVRTSKDVVIAQIGTDLYRTFFEGYTRKQWGLDPSELDKSVTARIPTRTSTDDRYFLDTYQAMPANGFTRLFENMLDHPNIRIELDVDYQDLAKENLAPRTIFTGPIDAFFEHRFGPLPYRSLDFRHEIHDVPQFQPVAVVNYPSQSVPYTRITEYKHLTGQSHAKTSISYEFSRPDGEPYYPVPRPENQILYKKYEQLAQTIDNVIFVGRLGTYKYYNMDQVVGQALATFRRLMRTEAGPASEWAAAAE
ncbi:MAG TPA: UDP-galactopyranose mutase [Xanthobacteraceae bacterium]|nr:UDP-galactopyranose mutase [Xanthobacteraceae bacterium]